MIPLTASIGGGNELLGSGPARPSGNDPLATRVLVRGEPVTAPAGRADNFAWPRSGVATIREGEPEEAQPASAPAAAAQTPTAAPRPRRAVAPQAPQPQRPPPVATAPPQRSSRAALFGTSSSSRRLPPRSSSPHRSARRRRARATIRCRGRRSTSRARFRRDWKCRRAQRGSVVDPIRNLSTECAAWRPSRIAHTTSDWPRRMSPQANTFGFELR